MFVMLYIHRKITDGIYGVVDTDDWSEDEVRLQDFQRICVDLGVDIKGVSVETVKGVRHVKSVSIFDRSIPGAETEVAKLKTLCDIDIKIVNGYIDSIVVGANANVSNLRFRLSDIAQVAGYHLFRYHSDWYDSADGFFMTFILDDKLDYAPRSMYNFYSFGVRLDISQLKNEQVVDEIYEELARGISLTFDDYMAVIDDPKRFDSHLAESALALNRAHYCECSDPCFKDKDFASKYVLKKYGKMFIQLSNLDLKSVLTTCQDRAISASSIMRWVTFSQDAMEILDSKDYEKIRLSRFGTVFDAVMELTYLTDNLDWVRFRNYINFFEVPVIIQRAFIRLCRNFVSFGGNHVKFW